MSSLQQVAEQETKTLVKAGEEFSNSLMGKAFKPLVNALIKYIKVTNRRLDELEGGANGK